MSKKFDVSDTISSLVWRTFVGGPTGEETALFGPVAYIGQGGVLYDEFRRVHSKSTKGPTSEQQLIANNMPALVNAIAGTERVVVIGGGPKDNFAKQDMTVIESLFRSGKLKEVALIDTSPEYLEQQAKSLRSAINKLKAANAELSKLELEIIPIQADFRSVAASAASGMNVFTADPNAPRRDLKTSVIMTGATFGNIENPRSEGFSTYQVTETMKALAAIAGKGGHVAFTYFYAKQDQRETDRRYNMHEFRQFILNIPKIIEQNCHGISGFKSSPDYWTYRPIWNDRSNTVEHRLIATKPQKFSLSNEHEKRDVQIQTGDQYTVLSSSHISSERLIDMPTQNTGLAHKFTTRNADAALQIFDVQRNIGLISVPPRLAVA